MVMKAIDELDEQTATLRMLVLLAEKDRVMNIKSLYNEMQKRYKVGRTAADSSRKALIRIGLAQEKSIDIERRKNKVIEITNSGYYVAECVRDLIYYFNKVEESS